MARKLKGKAKKETRQEKKACLARIAEGHQKAISMAPYVAGGAAAVVALLYFVVSRF